MNFNVNSHFSTAKPGNQRPPGRNRPRTVPPKEVPELGIYAPRGEICVKAEGAFEDGLRLRFGFRLGVGVVKGDF